MARFRLALLIVLLQAGCSDDSVVVVDGDPAPLGPNSAIVHPVTDGPSSDGSHADGTEQLDAISDPADGSPHGGLAASDGQASDGQHQPESSEIDPVVGRTVALAWRAGDDEDLGYYVYYGMTEQTVSRLGARVDRAQAQANGTFSASFSIDDDLAVTSGDTICFAVSAWTGSGEAEPSDAACVTLEG